MAEALTNPPASMRKRLIRPVLASLALALILGVGGFYAGLNYLPGLGGYGSMATGGPSAHLAFVPIPQLLVTLPPGATIRHLRLTAELEVEKSHAAGVQRMMPRILDMLNGYLRAVAVSELENPAALIRIRAHLLRRVQIITGEGSVRDFLVTEFVLN
jgi:flagellar FliL protein